MEDRFNFREAEKRLCEFWEKEGVYKFYGNSKKPIYAIDTPPPTMSGLIHLGHAFSYSQADFVARYKRMKGFEVFYPFGFDNNGLPTELLVEKVNNTTAEKVGRDAFVKMVEIETAKLAGIYKEVWKSIGISVDWSLLYTTISADVQKISQKSFIDLYNMGRAYRKETPTIWCPKDSTALSQMELKDKTLKSRFVDIQFEEGIVIATTRPEMLPACVAIFINPDDKRAGDLVGRKVGVPIFGQQVSIMADRRVDPEKGTGLVMCCTFGDLTDIEWYKAYHLELRVVIDNHGRMLPEYFHGKKIKEAREQVIADLKEKGYVVGEKEIEHAVNVHERCNTEIEFIVKKQWFIRYLDLKSKLLELGRQLNWHPAHMIARYENWVNGLQWDWSISRQRYYGIPFPVWYCIQCDEPVFARQEQLPVNPLVHRPSGKCPKCAGTEVVPEEDILDTWATSSLTPLINANWASNENSMDSVYPMALRPQAHDIISFWLFTTVVKCYLHTGKLPWKDVLISGHGLDSKGMPMHKSAGNIIEPRVVIEQYGADPLRHWASLSRLGDDASFQEKDVITGARLVNKLWNAAKFVEKNREQEEAESSNLLDRWIASKAIATAAAAAEMFDDYNYAGAKRLIDEFFWFFSDNYLEFIKHRTYRGDKSPNRTLNSVFLDILKMMAPFMPYVTEELYQQLYRAPGKAVSIHASRWPDAQEARIDRDSLAKGDEACRIIAYIRQWKHDNKMALNAELQSVTLSKDLGSLSADIKGSMNIKELKIGNGNDSVPETDVKITLVR
jgi:valyl-tRNA synthetase